MQKHMTFHDDDENDGNNRDGSSMFMEIVMPDGHGMMAMGPWPWWL